MTVFVLKMIAIFVMTIDHVGYMLTEQLRGGNYIISPELINWMRVLGRIAFPIFVFLIAEGCRHTKNMRKYLIRLLLFALLSEIPFNLLMNSGMPWNFPHSLSDLSSQNVYFTLFLGVLSVYLYQESKRINIALGIIGFVACAAAARFLHTDYGEMGVIAIFGAYILNKKPWRVLYLGACFAYITYMGVGISTLGFMCFGFVCVSLALIALYNGRQGPRLKWFFYAFYPVHLALIGLISMAIWGAYDR